MDEQRKITMSKRPGIIYELPDGKYGIAYNDQQHKSFKQIKKVYLHVFTDAACTQPEIDPKNGKKIVTLLHFMKIKRIGFVD